MKNALKVFYLAKNLIYFKECHVKWNTILFLFSVPNTRATKAIKRWASVAHLAQFPRTITGQSIGQAVNSCQ